MLRIMKKMTECARSGVTLDGEISNYVDILKGVAQGCTFSPNLFKVCIHDRIVAAQQGVMGGGDAVSGLMFADDSLGYHKHPEDCRNKQGMALEYTREKESGRSDRKKGK